MHESSHVSRVYNVAAVLYLQFLLHVMLFHVLNMFCTLPQHFSEVCVQCPIWSLFVVPLFLVFLVCFSGSA